MSDSLPDGSHELTPKNVCGFCKREVMRLFHEWRGVTWVMPICCLCANECVQKMIRNNELDDPFKGQRA